MNGATREHECRTSCREGCEEGEHENGSQKREFLYIISQCTTSVNANGILFLQTEKSSKQKNNVSRKIRAAETMSGAKCVDFISERVRCTYGSYEKTRSSAPPVFGLLRSDARGGVLVTDPRR